MEDFFTDRNSPEEQHKRATQQDPIIMYLIVRESLDMSIGKTAAQCAHASQMLQLKYHKTIADIEFEYSDPVYGMSQKDIDSIPSEIKNNVLIFEQWLDTSFRKVVLRADDKEWRKIKASGLLHVVVVDAGLTEIAAGSETVIGLWPMPKSLAPKLINKLQVL